MTEIRPAGVLVVGELNVDMVLSGPGAAPTFGQHEQVVDDCRVTLGSSSGIFACGTARLGHPTTMVGVVGRDSFGDTVRVALAERGVDTSAVVVDPSTPTGVTVILNTGEDRALLTYLGSIGATRREHVPAEALARASHLHVGCVFLQRALEPDLSRLFDEARAAGLTTSLDPNWDPAERWSNLLPVLGHVDVAFVNAAEAAALTGGLGPAAAADALAQHLRPDGTIVVKLGPDGALAKRGGETWTVPAVDVAVVDTTGAGDSFDAGFVHGMLSGCDIPACLSLGAACGSLSTRASGGTDAQPDLAELTATVASRTEVSP